MKSIITIIALLMMISCSGPRLNFALTNNLDTEIRNVEIRLPDTTLRYASVKPKTHTEWIKVKRAHSSAFLKFRDHSDTDRVFIPMITEDEKLYKGGYMQYIIYYPDSLKREAGTAFSRTPFMNTRVREE